MSKMVQYFAVASLALFLCAGAARAAGNEIRMAVERNAGPGALGELPAPTPPAEAKKDAAQAKKEAAEAKKPSVAKSDTPKPESSKPDPSKAAAAKLETPKPEAAKAPAKPDAAPPLVKVPDALRAEPAPKKKALRKKPAPKAETPAENATAPIVDAVPGGPTALAAATLGTQGAPSEGAGAVPAMTPHPGDSQKQISAAPVEKMNPAKPAPAAPVPAPVVAPAPKPKPVPVPVVDPKAFVMPTGPSNALEPITLPADTATGQFVGEVTLEFKPDSVVLHAATNGPVERTTHFNMDNPRKLAIDLRGPWRKKGGAVVRYDTGPVKVVVAGEHPDRLRLALEFREGAVRPEVSPTVELGPKGLTVTIPLAR